MKNFLTFLANGNYRAILIWLFIGPQTTQSIAKKCRLDDNEAALRLKALMDAELVELLHQHSAQSIYRLRPAIRQKVGKTFSRIAISALFLFVTTTLTFADKKLDQRQMKRLQKRNWRH